jgi:hypothetical protein
MSTLYVNFYCIIRAVTGNRQHTGFTEMWVSCQHPALADVIVARIVVTQASLKEKHFISHIFS